MLVFDKWTCNTNGRQTLFFRRPPGQHRRAAGAVEQDAGDSAEPAYETVMIDQGFCFNARRMELSGCSAVRLIYAESRVRRSDRDGIVWPWISRLEKGITASALVEMMGEIPPEWYADDYDALHRLVVQLEQRRTRIPELLLEAKRSNRQPFPSWR